MSAEDVSMAFYAWYEYGSVATVGKGTLTVLTLGKTPKES
jgi:hypothetical protein